MIQRLRKEDVKIIAAFINKIEFDNVFHIPTFDCAPAAAFGLKYSDMWDICEYKKINNNQLVMIKKELHMSAKNDPFRLGIIFDEPVYSKDFLLNEVIITGTYQNGHVIPEMICFNPTYHGKTIEDRKNDIHSIIDYIIDHLKTW